MIKKKIMAFACLQSFHYSVHLMSLHRTRNQGFESTNASKKNLLNLKSYPYIKEDGKTLKSTFIDKSLLQPVVKKSTTCIHS